MTNKALCCRLLEINNGKFSVLGVPPINSPSSAKGGDASRVKIDKSQSYISQSKLAGSLMSVARKKEDDRIAKENASLAQRMIRLPPVISHKRLEKDF